MEKVILNKQGFIIFSKNELGLITSGTFDGLPIVAFETIDREIKIAKNFDELKFALYKFSDDEQSWFYCIVVKLEFGWQRVFVEFIKCEDCQTKCISANQTLYDLYMLVPDKSEVYEKACSLPLASCPHCGRELPRPSVWNEKIEQR